MRLIWNADACSVAAALASCGDGTMTNSGQAPSGSIHYELTTILEPLCPAELFAQHQPLEVEAGCGDGSFLVSYAAKHPERNFIGIERLLGRIRKLDRKGRRAGLTNLRGVRIESSYFLKYLLPPGSVDVLHVYFPDPWPKRKHRRHRLVGSDFPALAEQVLKPNGRVYLRTDDTDYFEQMREVFQSNSHFKSVETPRELAELLTDFEVDFRAKGVPTLRAAYERGEALKR